MVKGARMYPKVTSSFEQTIILGETMLVNAKKILDSARIHHYAVPGFDCVEDVMIRTVLDTAEELRSPVFVMGYPDDLAGRGWNYIAGLAKAVADSYSIPIVLHLDHSRSMDEVRKALDFGFTSVMFDGSHLPMEQNIALSRKTVQLAEPYGATVEAELGLVGGSEVVDLEKTVENVLTEPEDVIRFVEETGVDILAVSIGTSHGVYKQRPTLDISRLERLNAVSRVPLVMHGGSGTPDEQIQEAIRHGICKLNIYADNRIALWSGFKAVVAETSRPDPPPVEYFAKVRAVMGQTVRQKIELCLAKDRA